MSIRFVDRGVTMRLFKTERSAKAYTGVVSTLFYQVGWIARNEDGRWVDADGVLPPNWRPNLDSSKQEKD